MKKVNKKKVYQVEWTEFHYDTVWARSYEEAEAKARKRHDVDVVEASEVDVEFTPKEELKADKDGFLLKPFDDLI